MQQPKGDVVSHRVVADVYDFGPDDPVDIATLVCLASHANDEGKSCFPSVARVARMTRRSERTIERSIAALEKDGWLVVNRGGGRGNVSSYTINVKRLKERQRDALNEEKSKEQGRQADAVSKTERATPTTQ
jgi:MarR-like DNA-binding transcriptional regulator SgrR of sgrS sRNA